MLRIRIVSFLFAPELDDFCYMGHPNQRRNMAIKGGGLGYSRSRGCTAGVSATTGWIILFVGAPLPVKEYSDKGGGARL